MVHSLNLTIAFLTCRKIQQVKLILYRIHPKIFSISAFLILLLVRIHAHRKLVLVDHQL